MLGAEYAACVSGSSGGTAFSDVTREDYSDLSILGGLSVDLPQGPWTTLRFSLLGSYSLTSKRHAQWYSGMTYVGSSGWALEVDLALEFLFVGRNAGSRL